MPKIVQLPKQEDVQPEKQVAPQNDRIIKAVTFFGDSAVPEDSDVYKEVWTSAKMLAESGYAIVNGGGPGVMKAATDGAESVNGHTIAIYWEPKLASIFEGKNLANVTDESEAYANYMMRTLGLIEKAQVYVVCKGGTGTVSEFGMVWALAKLYFGKHKPVILFGDFWLKLIDAFTEQLNIDEQELSVLYYAKTPEDILKLVDSFEAEMQSRNKRLYEGDESAFVVSSGVSITKLSYDTHAKEYHRERVGDLIAQDLLDEFISLVHPPARVLDIGCGAGFDLGYLADKYTMTGVDNSQEMLEIAKFENPESELILADIVSYEPPKNTFKGVWARDVLSHVGDNDQNFVFKKLTNAMVEGGIMMVVVREGEGESVEEQARAGYVMRRFYHYYTEEELKKRAETAGLKIKEIRHTQRSHKWLVGIFEK